MAEEQRCEAQETHRLCANNCGFFGSPATLNLCSKCFRDLQLKQQQQASIKSTLNNTSTAPSTANELPSLPVSVVTESVKLPAEVVRSKATVAVADVAVQPNRCSACRKRVGLTGFKCRCGVTFCGAHRYPEKHGCEFDFKKMGREEIARANPVVKADKLEKI